MWMQIPNSRKMNACELLLKYVSSLLDYEHKQIWVGTERTSLNDSRRRALWRCTLWRRGNNNNKVCLRFTSANSFVPRVLEFIVTSRSALSLPRAALATTSELFASENALGTVWNRWKFGNLCSRYQYKRAPGRIERVQFKVAKACFHCQTIRSAAKFEHNTDR